MTSQDFRNIYIKATTSTPTNNLNRCASFQRIGEKHRRSSLTVMMTQHKTNLESQRQFLEREQFYGFENFVSIYACEVSNSTGDGMNEEELDLSYLPVRTPDMVVISSKSKSLVSLNLSFCPGIGDSAIEKLNNMKKLTKLNLAGCAQVTDRSCDVFKLNLNLLRSLDISESSVTDTGIIKILEGCLYLESLYLTNVANLGNGGLKAIQCNISLMKLLSCLNLAGCTRFSNESLISLLEHGGSVITKLDLSRCVQIDLGLIGFRRNFTSTSCLVLKLHGLTGICDATMSWLAEGCKKLQHLDLSSCRLITDSSLGYLARGCTNLKEINLSKCFEITDIGLSSFISVAGRQLKTIILRNCGEITDTSIVTIAKICEKLGSLDIFGVPQVSDLGLENVAKRCRYLTFLDFSSDINSLNSSRKARVPQIGSAGVASLGQHCSKLTSLRCKGAAKLDSRGLIGLSKKCHNLHTLSFRYCYKLENDAIIALANQCHSIVNFDIGCCTKITDPGIIAISKGCHEIEQLNLHGLRHLTDRSILSLSRGCCKLRTLILSGCERLTDTGVCGIIERCQYITELDLNDVGNITDVTVNKMSKCNLLRCVDLSFTESSHQSILKLSHSLPFAIKSPAKMLLQPTHSQLHGYMQFVKYHSFLCIHQRTMSKIIRAFIYKRAYIRRRNLLVNNCKTIQKYVRCFLIRRTYRRSRKKHVDSSLVLFVHIYRYQRMKKKLVACIILIQQITRRYLHQKIYRAERDTKLKLYQEEMQLIEKERKQGELMSLRANELAWQQMIACTSYEIVISIKNSVCHRKRWRDFALFLLNQNRSLLQEKSCKIIQRWWCLHVKRICRCKLTTLIVEIQKYIRRFLYVNHYRVIMRKRHAACFVIQSSFRSYLRWQQILKDVTLSDENHKEGYVLTLARIFVVKVYWENLLKKVTKRILFADKKFVLIHLFDRRVKVRRLQSVWRRFCARKRSNKIRSIILRWVYCCKLVFVRQKIQHTIRIQRWTRLQMWLRVRRYAVTRIQNFCRIHKAYAVLNLLKLDFQHQSAEKIQRYYRIYVGRCYRNYWWWVYDNSVRIIQNSYRRHKALDTFHCGIRKFLSIQNVEREKEKKSLVLSRYERRLRHIFCTRDNKAVNVIQRAYRSYLEGIKLQKAKEVQSKIEDEQDKIENLRRSNILLKKTTKQPGFCFRICNAMIKVKEIAKSKKDRGSNINSSSISLIHQKRKEIIDLPWYSMKLENVLENTNITPGEAMKLYSVFEKVDYLKEGLVDVMDIFEFIDEPMSIFAEWVLSLKELSFKSRLHFHEYVDFVHFLCMLSRDDIFRILFSSIDLKKKGFLYRDEWINYIDIMTTNESVVHCNRATMNSFEKFSEIIGCDRERKLFFDGFKNIMKSLEFLAFPVLRFQIKIREMNFGRRFWKKRAKTMISIEAD